MRIGPQFRKIKQLFFPRWDRDDCWRISTNSRRRVHGHCDVERQVIEIVVQHADADKRDGLLIHEICHAVAKGNHGKVWQRRMEAAARRADGLGRHGLAKWLMQEVADYQNAEDATEEAYRIVQDWLACNPGLSLAQVRRSLADLYGLLVSEVGTTFKKVEKVYRAAKQDSLEVRALKAETFHAPSQPYPWQHSDKVELLPGKH
jgi:hypothetical protein